VPTANLAPPNLFVDPLILGAAVLIAIGVAVTGVSGRFRVPSLLLFLGAGMLVADDGLSWIEFADARLAQNLSVLALVVILFEGGLSTRWPSLRSVLVPASLLATVGVAITAGVVAAAFVLAFGGSGNTALVIGAVVSSTDAAAVFRALRNAPLPRRLNATLEAESGLNDPMAILLTVAILEAHQASIGLGDVVWFGTRQLLLGGVIGVALGIGGSRVFERVQLPSASLYPVLAAAIGAGAYGLAVLVGGSGFLSVYLAGVFLAEGAPRRRRALRTFHEGLAAVAEAGLFFLLGILVFPSQLPDVAGQALTIAAVLAFLARPLAVLVSVGAFSYGWRELVVLAWGGLRGAVPIVLATFPLTAQHPDGELIFDVVFFVVVLSATVQGTTLATLARRLGLHAEPEATAAVIELSPVDTLAADIIEVELTEHAAVVGRALREAPLPGTARIALVGRDGDYFVPSGSTILATGDRLVISTESSRVTPDVIEAWLRSVE
jgi:potassium/hydrogen antiporter